MRNGTDENKKKYDECEVGRKKLIGINSQAGVASVVNWCMMVAGVIVYIPIILCDNAVSLRVGGQEATLA